MNKNMVKTAWKIALINLRTLKTPYFVTALLIGFNLFLIGAMMVGIAKTQGMSSPGLHIASGGAPFVLTIMAAIFIPTVNFRRICNLGGNRQSFFLGSLIAYVLIAIGASLVGMAEYLGIDAFVKFVESSPRGYFIQTLHLVSLWTEGGIVVGFFKLVAHMFWLAIFVHVLAAVQGKWYGWAADVGLVMISAAFRPLAPLNNALDWFFSVTISNPGAPAQILSCFVLGIALYALSWPVMARKAI
ncbi:MAG: hypothetical protein FWD88_05810 [Treponema sp.]|nr:hypothetical protein [Treponema sp.]